MSDNAKDKNSTLQTVRGKLNYDSDAYAPIAVTVDLAIFTVRAGLLQILLIERAEEPFAGYWALPGGFVKIDESVTNAARRELSEETGLRDIDLYLEQLATYGTPNRDPRTRVVSVAYVALIPDLPLPIAGGDAASARFWPVDEIKLNGRDDQDDISLAFDHALIVNEAIERVRSKLEYTTLATAFVSEPFSLAEVRRVYEAVWGKAPDLANFRRKLLSTDDFVVPAGSASTSGSKGGRPAALYRRGSARRLHPPILRAESDSE